MDNKIKNIIQQRIGYLTTRKKDTFRDYVKYSNDKEIQAVIANLNLVYSDEIATLSEISAALQPSTLPLIEDKDFQNEVSKWLLTCFGEEISNDKIERNHRFLEEALELVQSLGCTKSEASQLLDYVFDRETGEPVQETGGVLVTLAALCYANNLDMQDCGDIELSRVWGKIDKIREKQANKPKHSALPQSVPLIETEALLDEIWDDCSEYIDTDIDSLQHFAGSSVITRRGYQKLRELFKNKKQ